MSNERVTWLPVLAAAFTAAGSSAMVGGGCVVNVTTFDTAPALPNSSRARSASQ